MLQDFLKRLTSRKFLAAVAAYSIVMLAGLGVADFDREVVAAATAALITYIGVQGVVDRRG